MDLQLDVAVIHQDSYGVIAKSQLINESQPYQFTETRRWQMVEHFVNQPNVAEADIGRDSNIFF